MMPLIKPWLNIYTMKMNIYCIEIFTIDRGLSIKIFKISSIGFWHSLDAKFNSIENFTSLCMHLLFVYELNIHRLFDSICCHPINYTITFLKKLNL